MQNSIPMIIIETTRGSVPGGFDLETALAGTREVERDGRQVLRLMIGATETIEGEELRRLLADL